MRQVVVRRTSRYTKTNWTCEINGVSVEAIRRETGPRDYWIKTAPLTEGSSEGLHVIVEKGSPHAHVDRYDRPGHTIDHYYPINSVLGSIIVGSLPVLIGKSGAPKTMLGPLDPTLTNLLVGSSPGTVSVTANRSGYLVYMNL